MFRTEQYKNENNFGTLTIKNTARLKSLKKDDLDKVKNFLIIDLIAF